MQSANHLTGARTTWRRRATAVCIVAAVQAAVFVLTFAIALGIGDGSGHVPALLGAVVGVLGVPAFFLVGPVAQRLLGDPLEIVVAAAVGGLAWGIVIVTFVSILRSWYRSRRARVEQAG